MQSLHREKKAKKIGVSVVVIFFLIVANPFGITTKIRSGVGVVLSPLAQIGYGVGTKYIELVHMLRDIGRLYDENQELLESVKNLEARSAYYMDVETENQMLRNELNLLPRSTYELIGADVIMRDALGGNQWVMINRGKDAGVEENMAVIVGESVFIGYVDTVDLHTARVRLITHPESVVNLVGEKNGAEAIMRGNHGLSAAVEDIKKDDVVENGEMFITSSIGTRFPRGLVVGRAQNISLSDDQLFQRASIMPLAVLDELRMVFVVKQ